MYQVARSSQFDLEKISECNRLCFPNSFSTKLGNAVVIKTFQWFLAGENRFLYHVNCEGDIVGYIGALAPQYTGDGSTSGMMRYAMKQAVVAFAKKPWLIFNKQVLVFYPLILKNIFRIFFNEKPKVQPAQFVAVAGIAKRLGLVVIGVHPAFRGKGVFELLMNQFENEAISSGIKLLTLSVKADNLHAINAYKKVGWRIAKEHKGSVEMVKTDG